MTAPTFDLDEIKDDIGMPPGTTNDAWLQRRIESVWTRMENYCNRYLGTVAPFIDQWRPPQPERQVPVYWPMNGGVAYYLRNYPVKQITAALDHGSTVDPATVLFDHRSGLLLGHGELGAPSSFMLPTITYDAGYETIPADLYECMIGMLQAMWVSRANSQSGVSTGGIMPSQIDITDVGSIVMGAGNMSGFVGPMASGQSADYSDPLLGPYAYVLDHYRDLRAEIGSIIMPITTVPP